MSIGSVARRLLGRRLARVAGHAYRAVFMDLARWADSLAPAIPGNAHVLDVGGGDGAPLNYLLARRPDISVTTIDIASKVGEWIDSRHEDRVVRLPGISLLDYVQSDAPRPDVLLLSDVMHHIPASDRVMVWHAVAKLLERKAGTRIIIKDVEPGYVRAKLGYWADKYITGDATVSPVSRSALKTAVREALGPLQCDETELFEVDKPNFALVFYR